MFNSDGAKPSEVVDRLHALGFRPTKGNFDFAYEWDKNATIDDTIWFADQIYATLKGMKVVFKLETK
jgi:hypothetical protein